jgi:hypothetical protein
MGLINWINKRVMEHEANKKLNEASQRFQNWFRIEIIGSDIYLLSGGDAIKKFDPTTTVEDIVKEVSERKKVALDHATLKSEELKNLMLL